MDALLGALVGLVLNLPTCQSDDVTNCAVVTAHGSILASVEAGDSTLFLTVNRQRVTVEVYPR